MTHCQEIITAQELAKRWGLPVTWIYAQTRSRIKDAIPHLRFGKYIKFAWDSPELEAWFQRRMSTYSGSRNRLSQTASRKSFEQNRLQGPVLVGDYAGTITA